METPDGITLGESNVIKLANGRGPGKPALGQELGVPQSMPFGSFVDFLSGEYLAPNTALVSLDKLVEMRQKDGTARALLRLFTLPIMRSLRDSEWIAPEDEEAEQETEFANLLWTTPPQNGGMSVTRSQFMRHALLAVFEGFSVFEKVFFVPEKGPLEGLITYRKLAHRDARTIEFLTDDHGGFNGVKQTANVKGQTKQVVLKKEKVWYYSVHEEENPFYGVSLFEAAWHHWDIKRKLYYIAHLAAQMAAVPGRLGTIPMNADPNDVKAFQAMLADYGFNTSGTKLKDWEVEFSNMNSQFNFLGLIDHQNQQMAKSVLAKFLEDTNRQVLIDNGGQDASADFFVMAVEAIMYEIAESMSHYLLPDLIDYNFASGIYPEFRFGVLNDATRDVIKDLFTVIATAQTTQWTPEFIRELEKKLTDRLGLEVDYDEVDQREEKEQAQQAQMEQAYYAQRGGGPGAPGQPGGGQPGGQPGAEQGGGNGQGGGGGQQPFNVQEAILASQEMDPSVTGGGLSWDRVMDRVEALFLARRESDLDGGA